jgi:hypothetical protein
MLFDWEIAASWFSGVASAAAVVVALWLARKSDRDRASERQQARKAIARKLLSEIMEIANSFYTIKHSFEQDFQGLVPPQPAPAERWRLTRPLIGLAESDAIYVDDAALMLLMEADPKLYQDVILVADKQRVLVRLLAEYGIRRNALLEMLPQPVEVEDDILFGVVPDGPEHVRLRAHARAVEDLLSQAWAAACEGQTDSMAIAERVGPVMRTFLSDEKFPLIGAKKIPETSQAKPQ